MDAVAYLAAVSYALVLDGNGFNPAQDLISIEYFTENGTRYELHWARHRYASQAWGGYAVYNIYTGKTDMACLYNNIHWPDQKSWRAYCKAHETCHAKENQEYYSQKYLPYSYVPQSYAKEHKWEEQCVEAGLKAAGMWTA